MLSPSEQMSAAGIRSAEDPSTLLLVPSRSVKIKVGNDNSMIARLRLNRFPFVIFATLALVFGMIMLVAQFFSAQNADRSENFLSGTTNLVSKKRAPAFQKCAGKVIDKTDKKYNGCEIGCICEQVNEYYSQCTPPGEESMCSKKGAMPMVMSYKKKHESANEAAQKAQSKSIKFRKEADKAIGSAKWFKKEMSKATGAAEWFKTEAAKAANAAGFGGVTADNVLAKAQYIIDQANKASGKAKYLRDKANVAANKAKGIYPPSNCAKAFGQCNSGPKCCQEGCKCVPKEAGYSQCQIPAGFDSCSAAAASSAQEDARKTDATASGAEGIAGSKQTAAKKAADARDHQNKVDQAAKKSKEMDDAVAEAETMAKRMKIASEKAAKIELRTQNTAELWSMAVKDSKYGDEKNDDNDEKDQQKGEGNDKDADEGEASDKAKKDHEKDDDDSDERVAKDDTKDDTDETEEDEESNEEKEGDDKNDDNSDKKEKKDNDKESEEDKIKNDAKVPPVFRQTS